MRIRRLQSDVKAFVGFILRSNGLALIRIHDFFDRIQEKIDDLRFLIALTYMSARRLWRKSESSIGPWWSSHSYPRFRRRLEFKRVDVVAVVVAVEIRGLRQLRVLKIFIARRIIHPRWLIKLLAASTRRTHRTRNYDNKRKRFHFFINQHDFESTFNEISISTAA